MPRTDDIFSEEDIGILRHAVSIHPNLEYACYATKKAIEHLQFPIESYDDLEPLFQIQGLPDRIARREIQLDHVRRFFPQQFFPIEDSQDFLGKVLAALAWGDTIHYHEEFLKNPERFVQVPRVTTTNV